MIFVFLVKANGGDGYRDSLRGGGGGSGGRIALYYQKGFFDGFLEAAGGNGDVENGAAGTVYVERAGNSSARAYRTLKVDNKGRSPLTERINQVNNALDYKKRPKRVQISRGICTVLIPPTARKIKRKKRSYCSHNKKFVECDRPGKCSYEKKCCW